MNTPTPETDDFYWKSTGIAPVGRSATEWSDFSSKLERERDEANKSCERLAMGYNAIESERDQLRNVCDELYKNLSFVSSEQPENDILCADGFTMSFHRNSPLHKYMKVAIDSYNQLPHVKK